MTLIPESELPSSESGNLPRPGIRRPAKDTLHSNGKEQVETQKSAESLFTPEMNAPVGNTNKKEFIGPFHIEAQLGVGGMGTVYRVRDEFFDRELALKVVSKPIEMTDRSLTRFLSEGRLIGQLQHPAITPVYHLAQDSEGRWYYTMKQVRGRTLTDVLKAIEAGEPEAQAQWTLRRLLTVFVTICQALGYTHSRGVIHRDLKPDNIMLGEYGEVYVMDWGLAKTLERNLNRTGNVSALTRSSSAKLATITPPVIRRDNTTIAVGKALEAVRPTVETTEFLSASEMLGKGLLPDKTAGASAVSMAGSLPGLNGAEPPIRRWGAQSNLSGADRVDESPPLTLDGAILGTPSYMAPEQARSELHRHDQRTDVFSLGAILWRILTGQALRAGLNQLAALMAASEGTRPAMEEVARRRRIEPELKDACWKALEPRQEDRFSTALELGRAIQAWLDGERKWKLVYEADFSNVPDSQHPPEGWELISGGWKVHNGALVPVDGQHSVLHLSTSVFGDLRMEIEGWIDHGQQGELSVILCAPPGPVTSKELDGYLLQFGAHDLKMAKITRNLVPLHTNIQVQPVSGRRYLIRAECLDGELRMEIDGTTAMRQRDMRQRDLFPLAGTRVGLYSWAGGGRIQKVRVFTAGVPKLQSCLAVPNAFMQHKNWSDALTEFQRIVESHPGSAEADEAAFRGGLCLIELARYDDAGRMLETLRGTAMEPLMYLGMATAAEKQSDLRTECAWLMEGLVRPGAEADTGFQDLLARALARSKELVDQGKLEPAVELLGAICAGGTLSSPLHATALFELARRQFQAARPVEAVRQLKMVQADHGDVTNLCAEARLTEGIFLSAMGRFQESIALFYDLKNRYPGERRTCAEAICGIIHAHLRLGRVAPLRDLIVGLLKEYPEQTGTQLAVSNHLNWNMVVKDQSQFADLTEQLMQHAGKMPTWQSRMQMEDAREEVRRLLYQKNYEAALQYIDQSSAHLNKTVIEGLSAQPAIDRATFRMRALLEQKQWDRARLELDFLSTAFANDHADASKLAYWQACFMRASGQVAQANAFLLKQIDSNTYSHEETASLLLSMSLWLIADGQYKDAAKLLQRILNEHCTNSSYPCKRASLWLGLLAQKARHPEEAIHHWQQVTFLGDPASREHAECFWMSECLQSVPGQWRSDQTGTLITPYVARERMSNTLNDWWEDFQSMIDFRASFEPEWRPWATRK